MTLFSDDTLLYVSSITNLAAIKKNFRTILTGSNHRSTKGKLKLILQKLHQYFLPTIYTPKLKIQNTQILWSNTIKYLGVHIDNQLMFTKHVKHIINKTKAIRHILYLLINIRIPLSINTKIYI